MKVLHKNYRALIYFSLFVVGLILTSTAMADWSVLFPFHKTNGSSGNSTSPSLVYSASDLPHLEYLATGNQNAVWDPTNTSQASKNGFAAGLNDWSGSQYDYSFQCTSTRDEGNRAIALTQLGFMLWLNPNAIEPKAGQGTTAGQSYAQTTQWCISNISTAPVRSGGYISGTWGSEIQNAGGDLSANSLAADLLLSQNAGGAIGSAALNQWYAAVADGIFHVLVAHMQTSGSPATYANDNNWTMREMAGVGLCALVWRSYFQAEPPASQRAQDYQWVVQNIPVYTNGFLQYWAQVSHASGAAIQYYEGPHYWPYGAQCLIPYVQAYLRINGPNANLPALSFDPSQPIQEFTMANSALVTPIGFVTANGRTYPWYTNMPLDDSWLGEIDTWPPADSIQVLLAAWGKTNSPQNAAIYANVAAYASLAPFRGASYDNYTWNTTVDQDIAAAKQNVNALPLTQTAVDGFAIGRTGSTVNDLTVILKNTPTPFDPNYPHVPALYDHEHGDNGNVVAFVNGETVLGVPGYGQNGYGNANHVLYYTSWLHQNVLEYLDSHGGYDSGTLGLIGESAGTDPYIVPWHFDGDNTGTLGTQQSDAHGNYWVLTTNMADNYSHAFELNRKVVFDDSKSYILVFDQLASPDRVKVMWQGNGYISSGTYSSASGANWTRSVYTGGTTIDTQITVAFTGGISAFDNYYGEWGWSWGGPTIPISMTRSLSSGNEPYVVTLVEITPKGQQFHLAATPHGTGNSLSSVTLTKDGNPYYTYTVNGDGSITRN